MSVYSSEPVASFYRRLHKFMPSLIDVLLDATPQRRAGLAEALSFLAREYDERRFATARSGGDVAAEIVESPRRASLLYFLLHAPSNHFELCAAFVRKLVCASRRRRRLRARYIALRSVLRVQRAFRMRKLHQLGTSDGILTPLVTLSTPFGYPMPPGSTSSQRGSPTRSRASDSQPPSPVRSVTRLRSTSEDSVRSFAKLVNSTSASMHSIDEEDHGD
mmetsp:Transcript_30350/g.91218  ORF Transcript_30350/g.91218 Transcript_30350/m.91218 type:complete len:219 (-) Transcript_30350:175-831(-)